jgi:hypothetical protein
LQLIEHAYHARALDSRSCNNVFKCFHVRITAVAQLEKALSPTNGAIFVCGVNAFDRAKRLDLIPAILSGYELAARMLQNSITISD